MENNSYASTVQHLARLSIESKWANAKSMASLEEFNTYYKHNTLVFSTTLSLWSVYSGFAGVSQAGSASISSLIESRFIPQLDALYPIYKNSTMNVRFFVKFDVSSELLWTYLTFPA